MLTETQVVGGDDIELHKAIKARREAALPEASMLKVYRRYARGKQPIKLTSLQKEVVRALIGNRFCDNVVSMVLDTLSGRLRFSRFTFGDGSSQSAKSALERLDIIRQKNRWSDLASKTHWAMLRDGDCALCIGWKASDKPGDGRPLVTREPFWDGTTGVFLAYDEDGQTLEYAVKDWIEPDGTARRTVYFPDRIQRYAKYSSGTGHTPGFDPEGWLRYVDPGDPLYEVVGLDGQTVVTQWPVLWLDAEGKPIGVPFVHFPNTTIPNDGEAGDEDDTDVGKGVAGPGIKSDFDPNYGVSECANGLIGQQDHLNATHLDIATARKSTALQMYWATGVEDTDDEGKPIEFKPRAGKMLVTANEEAKFGTLPASDLGALTESIDVTLRAVSRTTKVPMHTFTGDWPSGTAIYQSESGLNFKAERIAESTKPFWGAVGYWCLKLDNIFGGQNWDLEAVVGAEFAPVARLDPLVLSELANALAEHVSDREYLRLVGYDEKDIERILAERKADQESSIAKETALADAAARRFNRGNPAPNVPPTPPPAPAA